MTMTIIEVCYYVNMPMQYAVIFHSCENDNFQIKKAVLTSAHNLYFTAKIRK